jgi:hypothetical protein
MKSFIYIPVLWLLCGLFSCKPTLKEPSADKGSLDVSKYVAIGNSITSGYADGALYYDGQLVAYPNLLAEQFKLVGGGEFRQPLVPAGSPGIGSSANAKLILGFKADCKGVTGLSPVPFAPAGDQSIFAVNISAQGPFQNLGVPGAKSFHVPYQGYGTVNPFFGRMVANASSASMLGEAAMQQPGFFSLFIGNNDVLSYALAGGAADSITAPPVFNASIDGIVNTMTGVGAKGVIGNIPDITSLPYFTTVPYNGLVLTRQGQVDSLNFAYAQVGITFVLGANAFVMSIPAPPFVRKMKPNELLLLSTPQDSLKCAGWGSKKALGNRYVLSETEIAAIQSAVQSYNGKLKSVADGKGLAFVDVNAFMANCKKGIVYNGITIGTTFVSGGAFSLDGIHLTPLGNALLANEFIKAINATYGSTIPFVSGTKYRGVAFP